MPSEADVIVYKSEWKSDAASDSGIWFFTEWKSEADIMIYFTEWRSEADLVICYTSEKAKPVSANSDLVRRNKDFSRILHCESRFGSRQHPAQVCSLSSG